MCVDDLTGRISSALSGIDWPAAPPPDAAQALALQFQLGLSEWYDGASLAALQFRQLEVLLRHAHATVPYYRERWHGLYDPSASLDAARFARLPLLTRSALQQQFGALTSSAPPTAHGAPSETRSSGSTGTPVRVLKTPVSQLVWQAVMLREHLWHRRDFGAKLAVIRRVGEPGERAGWGEYIGGIIPAGRAAALPISVEIGRQLDWLAAQQPDYLLTYPTNAAGLARRSIERGVRLAGLRQVMTIGEIVTPELRALCRDAWDAPVKDAYSAQETGYLALQCPDRDAYHVQSETVLVEVLDRRGNPCAPGETGLVVVTPLHAFAMPLVRYVVGDYARVGALCPCGRGLPVLERIMGRTRNTLVLANGERYWPYFGTHRFVDLAPILQHQFVQTGYDVIEARLVTARPLTGAEEDDFVQHVRSCLPAPFEIRIRLVPGIPRDPGSKYEDFVSELAGAGGAG
ncbi:MAG: phenylacetate--CoA ligase family protein [Burkholderiales bacterium]|nr:phenylacetate--CoA ligase family protein [Burkholderiales bacterium]